jgi:hypothetical protein
VYQFNKTPMPLLIHESNSHQALIPDISPAPSYLYVDRIVSHISLRTTTETSKFERKFFMSSIFKKVCTKLLLDYCNFCLGGRASQKHLGRASPKTKITIHFIVNIAIFESLLFEGYSCKRLQSLHTY